MQAGIEVNGCCLRKKEVVFLIDGQDGFGDLQYGPVGQADTDGRGRIAYSIF